MATKHTLTREKRKKERRSQINGKRLSESKIAMGFIYHIACVAIDQWHENGRIHMYIELSTVVYCFFCVASSSSHSTLRVRSTWIFFLSNWTRSVFKNSGTVGWLFLADTVVIDNIRRFRLDSLFLSARVFPSLVIFSRLLFFPIFFSYALLVL